MGLTVGASHNIERYYGDSTVLTFDFDSCDLTDLSVWFAVTESGRVAPGSELVECETGGSGITVTDAEEGQLSIQMSNAQLDDLLPGDYTYVLKSHSSEANRRTLAYGRYRVLDVTDLAI